MTNAIISHGRENVNHHGPNLLDCVAASGWWDSSASAVLDRLDAALGIAGMPAAQITKVSTLGNGGIGEGGSLNNTDASVPIQPEVLPLKPGVPNLSNLSGWKAGGLDVSGGGASAPFVSESCASVGSNWYYNERVATSSLSTFDACIASASPSPKDEHPWPDCARWSSHFMCDENPLHRYYKPITCGREWCPDCGAVGSWVHNRRFARWLPKAQQMDGFGYFVLEWSLVSRSRLRSQRALSDMGKRAKKAFQVLGFKRGLRRWHYFGESGAVFNPHLNVLVEAGYLSKRRLAGIKVYLRRVLDEPALIVHYSYKSAIPQMVHTLKYVARATFLDFAWDTELGDDLLGFQNTNYWGSWKDEPVWSMGEKQERYSVMSSLSLGVCPICGCRGRWNVGGVMPIAKLWNMYVNGRVVHVDAGYFRYLHEGSSEGVVLEDALV